MSKQTNTFFTLISVVMLSSCVEQTNTSNTKSNEVDTNSLEENKSNNSNTLYASIDSTFEINDKTFKVKVNQFDLSEDAYQKGDTLPRPTYVCTMEIYSNSGTILYQDSLLRDSWGYPGKIESISAYQISLPQLFYLNDEIIASYNIYEMNSMDAIIGSVAFNVQSMETRMFWEEVYLE